MSIANQADNYGAGKSFSGEHPAETELLQYLEGNLEAQERGRIEKHLETCPSCLQAILAVREQEARTVAAQELEEAQKLAVWTPEQHVAKILETQKKEHEKNRGSNAPFLEGRPPRPVTGPKLPGYWRPLAAAAVIVLALVVGSRGMRYYQRDYQIAQATKLLKEQHRIFIKDARLSGGYASSGISILMGEAEEQHYLKQSRTRLEKAIGHGDESIQARQLLAQILIIEKEYTRADSILRSLAPVASRSPALLNDLGVYYFQRQDWANAEKYFLEAVKADPKFPEARYNLALVKLKTGTEEEATAIVDEYLQIETDENWKRAAQSLKDDLRK